MTVTAPPPTVEAASTPPPRRGRRLLLVLALLLVACGGGTMFGLRQIGDDAMSPTLEAGDHVLVNRAAYFTRLPFRGDIVVLAAGEATRLGRVVGIGGDTVEMRKGRLYVGGEPVSEAWTAGAPAGPTEGPWRVPGGHVFVLNDRRTAWPDSRQFGALPVTTLRGHVMFRLSPAARRGWL